MPKTVVTDGDGNTMRLFEFKGKNYTDYPFIKLDEVLSNLPDLPGREDDVVILTYPKSGTTWMTELVTKIFAAKGGMGITNGQLQGMLEMHPGSALENLSSVRLLVTHLSAEFYPSDLVKKKSKIIYVMRNPKDALVSYYHFIKKIKLFDYQGTWDGYFNLAMDDKSPYGNWFDFTKSWDKFFKEHTDVPVLILYYENMKMDLRGEIQKLVEFLDIPCGEDVVREIAEKCMFDNMQKDNADVKGLFKALVIGQTHPMFRKGVVGDWKNEFTVAQNERFDAKYKEEMPGWTFHFDQYM